MTSSEISLTQESFSSQTFAASPIVRFPKLDRTMLDQDEEWCEVYADGQWKKLRLHDYADIYNQPGLYEHIFAGLLECTSPQRVTGLMADVARDHDIKLTDLSVLDLGAGNGMVGEQLRFAGMRHLVGIDIIPEAGTAAERDRPGLYDDYIVADLCQPTEDTRKRLRQHNPNLLVSVSALGFGDIPPQAFWNALEAIQTPGWVAFNIKSTFLAGDDSTGFCRLIRALMDQEVLELHASRRYSHRLNVQGERLHYVAMVARKLTELPEGLLESIQ